MAMPAIAIKIFVTSREVVIVVPLYSITGDLSSLLALQFNSFNRDESTERFLLGLLEAKQKRGALPALIERVGKHNILGSEDTGPAAKILLAVDPESETKSFFIWRFHGNNEAFFL